MSSHAIVITKEQPYGSFKVVSSANGRRRALSYGYMENVCSSASPLSIVSTHSHSQRDLGRPSFGLSSLSALHFGEFTLPSSSAVIQDILTRRDVELAFVAYFYFDFRDRDKQNRRKLLASLLIQLSARSAPCCKALSSLREIHENGERQPSEEVLIHCLKDMLTIVGQHPTYIILDALDECPNSSGIPSPREQVLALVKELVGLSLPNLHLCVTSRPEVDIRSTLEPLAPYRVSLHEESGQKKDIVKYINSVVHSDADTMMKKWREDERESVVETLSDMADGM